MGFGIRLRTLWTIRGWVVLCAAFAALVAVWSVCRISLSPPGLTSRSLEMATATTQVVVDTPRSTLFDIRQDTYALEALTNRALLLGNVLASPEVRHDIAARAQVPFNDLQVMPPLTPKQPRALAEAGHERHTTDILKLNGQYRLYIRANPTVPFLQIYSETPTVATAAPLADAAVGALQTYLDQLAQSTKTPSAESVHITQLGNAEGTVVNAGIKWKAALLVFAVMFALACGAVLWGRRVIEGWRLSVLAERSPV